MDPPPPSKEQLPRNALSFLKKGDDVLQITRNPVRNPIFISFVLSHLFAKGGSYSPTGAV